MSDPATTFSLEVNGHKVPAIAYKRIVELWRSGWTETEITQEAMNTMGQKKFGVISEIVLGAINDQKFAFALSGKTARENYLDIPIDSPGAIRKAIHFLEETSAALAWAKSIEDKYAIEAMRLLKSRPFFIEDAKTYSERMERQAHIDQMTKEALQKRQKAEEEILHLTEVEKIRHRLFMLSIW